MCVCARLIRSDITSCRICRCKWSRETCRSAPELLFGLLSADCRCVHWLQEKVRIVFLPQQRKQKEEKVFITEETFEVSWWITELLSDCTQSSAFTHTQSSAFTHSAADESTSSFICNVFPIVCMCIFTYCLFPLDVRTLEKENKRLKCLPVIFNSPPTGLNTDSLYKHASAFNKEWWISDLWFIRAGFF